MIIDRIHAPAPDKVHKTAEIMVHLKLFLVKESKPAEKPKSRPVKEKIVSIWS